MTSRDWIQSLMEEPKVLLQHPAEKVLEKVQEDLEFLTLKALALQASRRTHECCYFSQIDSIANRSEDLSNKVRQLNLEIGEGINVLFDETEGMDFCLTHRNSLVRAYGHFLQQQQIDEQSITNYAMLGMCFSSSAWVSKPVELEGTFSLTKKDGHHCDQRDFLEKFAGQAAHISHRLRQSQTILKQDFAGFFLAKARKDSVETLLTESFALARLYGKYLAQKGSR